MLTRLVSWWRPPARLVICHSCHSWHFGTAQENEAWALTHPCPPIQETAPHDRRPRD